MKSDMLNEVSSVQNMKAWDELRVALLGKKGKITEMLKALSALPLEEKIARGKELNVLKSDIEKALEKEHIETYIPCEETLVIRNGIKKTVRKPMISSLMFFRATTADALKVQKMFTDKVILYTRLEDMKRIPLVIPDEEMNTFMLVTSAGEKGIEYYDDAPKFHQGDRVRVTDGKFKGAEGYICRVKKNRRLVVSIQGVCAVLTSYIPRSFLEIISKKPTVSEPIKEAH